MHLLDDSVMKRKSYVAGVTNPMYKSMTKKWDLYCDIETGEITESENPIHDKIKYEIQDHKMLVIDKLLMK